MEHLQNSIIESLGLKGSDGLITASRLLLFGTIIHRENKIYNLTGHKTVEDIIEHLIIESILPLDLIDVPRGTSIADMGTGAGIPGIPLAILYPRMNFTLFDSNSKKIRFIDHMIQELKLENLQTVCGRLEDSSRKNEYRERFDIAVSRAMADVYMACELCSPFVVPGGYIYLYISEKQKHLPSPVVEHMVKLSLETACSGDPLLPVKVRSGSGLLLRKTSPVADIYPRRISAIKRGASEIEKKHI